MKTVRKISDLKKKNLWERSSWSELVTLSDDVQKLLLFFRWSIMIRAEFRHISRKLGRKSKKAWTDSFNNGL